MDVDYRTGPPVPSDDDRILGVVSAHLYHQDPSWVFPLREHFGLDFIQARSIEHDLAARDGHESTLGIRLIDGVAETAKNRLIERTFWISHVSLSISGLLPL